MRHITQLDENNVVTRVVVADSDDITVEWMVEHVGGVWMEFNGRGEPNLGATWTPELDAFVPFKLYNSWVLNEDTLQWEAPIPRPEGDWSWNEDSVSWEPLTI